MLRLTENIREDCTDLDLDPTEEAVALFRGLDEDTGSSQSMTHLPCSAAECASRGEPLPPHFQRHLSHCNWCQTLVATMQPASPREAAEFGARAAAVYQNKVWRRLRTLPLVLALTDACRHSDRRR